MTLTVRPSALDRLVSRPLVGRLARSASSRSSRLAQRYDRRLRRIENRRLAAAIVEWHGTEGRFAEGLDDRAVSTGQIRAESPSSITTRFIVLSEGRSGSTLLVDELDRRWPEIRSRREVFSRRPGGGFDGFANVARRTFIHDTGEAIVGCKIFAMQISEQELESLLQLDGMRVIILRRRNQLRRHVSMLIARKTTDWHGNQFRLRERSLTSERRSIAIDPRELLKEILNSSNRFRCFEKATVGVPRIDVWYEDLSADLDNELRRVATFLGAGAPAHESPPHLTRQNPEALRELITNFDEISDFLCDVGLAEFLVEAKVEGPTPEVSPEVSPEGSRGVPGVDQDRWPGESQLLLLRALIGPEDSLETNWTAALSTKPVWTSSADAGDLYPSIHHRLRLAPHLAGDLFDFRAESMLRAAEKIRAFDALHELTDRCFELGLTVTVLEATALMVMTRHHDSIGFRTLPMSGLDLSSPPEQFDPVSDLLHRLGWTIAGSTDEHAPGASFERDGLSLRLHRTILRAATTETGSTAGLEQDIRSALIPAPGFDSTCSMPAPAELLITTIIDGLYERPGGSITWILSAHRLIADTREDLDWDRFTELTEIHRLQFPARAAMTLLEDLTDLRQEDRRQ